VHPPSRSWRLPPGLEQSTFSDAIRGLLTCRAEPIVESSSLFLDSFDWRLSQSGAALEERTGAGSGRELLWLDLKHDATVVARQPAATEPTFADSVPAGPVQELLAPILGIRRLLPRCRLQQERATWRVLNDDEKTVARIVLERNRVVATDCGSTVPVSLPMRLLLRPVRGYCAELEETAAALERILSLAPTGTSVYHEALAAAGCRPGHYSSKLSYRLDPEQRADVAARTIHLGLLDTLEANVDGARRNLDTEFLHDLRVATRRTRSALSQIKDVFAPSVVEDFKGRFAWLQQVTGPVRDLDVYLLDFPRLRGDLPAAMRGGLEPLRSWLVGHYDAEQARLVDALESDRFQALLREWHDYLEGPVPARPEAANGSRPIKELADERIGKMYKRVRREGRAITDASADEELHELRKSCKKLRYLMEFFQSLYPRDSIRPLIKESKILLDNLGAFQDLAIQAGHLRDTAARLQAEGAADTDAMLAMGALIGTMLARQERARDALEASFARFDSPENRKAFKRLLARPAHVQAGAGGSPA
jgi:CHAD domain-containing protein